MLTEIRLKLIKEGHEILKKAWSVGAILVNQSEIVNTEYAYRALVALAGLGANTVEVALYPKTEQDADGNPLTGEKSYTPSFRKLSAGS